MTVDRGEQDVLTVLRTSDLGKAFEDAGHRQWGQGIQHDIIDATRWAIQQGHADEDRICIYGGSFGGYLALMAPAREPGLYTGARAARAVPEQTEAMHKALTAAGNPPEGMLIQSGEMHGFYKEENNLNLYTQMLAFFARHIGTDTVDAGAPKRAN